MTSFTYNPLSNHLEIAVYGLRLWSGELMPRYATFNAPTFVVFHTLYFEV